MRNRVRGVCILFAVIYFVHGHSLFCDEKKDNAVDEKTIRSLIVQLSDDSFEKREAAQKSLADIGLLALPFVQKALKESKDAEVLERARYLLEDMQKTGLIASQTEFYHDFRKAGITKEKFALAGPNAGLRVLTEPQGLRITLPAEPSKKYDGVGVSAKFGIMGDFEVTASYEVIDAPKPMSGRGVGVEFYLMIDSAKRDAIIVTHSFRQNGTQAYECTRVAANDQGRRQMSFNFESPADCKTGALRMIRVGSKAMFAYRSEKDKDFRPLASVAVATDDVRYLRIGANPGSGPNAIDVRVLDLRVRATPADALTKLPDNKTAPKK